MDEDTDNNFENADTLCGGQENIEEREKVVGDFY